MPEQRVVSRNFSSLEGLRGYMAWAVVVSHALTFMGVYTLLGPQSSLSHVLMMIISGSKAVNVFIILSGFVITHLALGKTEPYSLYITRRGLRIIPIYLLCLVLAVLFLDAQMHMHTTAWIAKRDDNEQGFMVARNNLLPYLGLHLTLLHGLVPDTWLDFSGWALLGPAWSLSLEWQFYLVAPVIIYFLRKSQLSQIVSSLLLLAAYAFATHCGLTWRYPSMLFLSINLFLIGMLSRIWFDRIVAAKPWVPFVAAGAVLLVFHGLWWEIAIWLVFMLAALVEAGGTFAAGAPRLQQALRLITANKPIMLLGRSSYSTYLIHIVLFAILTEAGRRLGYASQRDTILLVCLGMLLLVPVSLGLYRFIENPFIQLGRRLSRPAPVASPVSNSST